MAEEAHRNPSDTTAYGYRQLPGSGSAGGIDLKTLGFGVIGVAMGIVVGTLAADGSLSAMIRPAALHSVQASIHAPKPPAPQAAKPAPAQAAPLKSLAAVQETAHATPKPTPELQSAAPKTPVLKVSASGKARPAHKLVSRKRRLGRRRVHSRHRARFHPKTKFINDMLVKLKVINPIEDAKVFTYIVEGDVTVASYDASLGRIETFEGEAFALNQIPTLGDVVPLDAYPGNLHYRCDQSWNCTLFRDGATIMSAKRTK
jgi:hypothetical protein